MRAVHGAWFAGLAAWAIGGCALLAGLPDVHLDASGGGGTGGASSSTGGTTSSTGGGAAGGTTSSSSSTGTVTPVSSSSGTGGCSAIYAATILADAPVGYWRLGDASATAASALVGPPGTYSAGVMVGQPGAIACDTATSVHFDGVDGNANMGMIFPFTNAAPFSVEAWVNPEALVNGAVNHGRILNREGADSGNMKQGWNFVFATDGVLLRRYQDGGYDAATGPVLPLNTWTHVAGTFDGATLTIYENGIARAANSSTKLIKDSLNPLLVGAEDLGGSAGNMKGRMEEIAIYDRALTPAQIMTHYQAGLP